MKGLPHKPSIVMEGLTNFDHITLTDSVSLFAICWCLQSWWMDWQIRKTARPHARSAARPYIMKIK